MRFKIWNSTGVVYLSSRASLSLAEFVFTPHDATLNIESIVEGWSAAALWVVLTVFHSFDASLIIHVTETMLTTPFDSQMDIYLRHTIEIRPTDHFHQNLGPWPWKPCCASGHHQGRPG
jgi:hypothetical protein